PCRKCRTVEVAQVFDEFTAKPHLLLQELTKIWLSTQCACCLARLRIRVFFGLPFQHPTVKIWSRNGFSLQFIRRYPSGLTKSDELIMMMLATRQAPHIQKGHR